MLENGFHKKLKHEVWHSPRVVWLLLNVNWVLLSEKSWRVVPPVHNPFLANPPHEFLDYVYHV
jgi:hypothetical protein